MPVTTMWGDWHASCDGFVASTQVVNPAAGGTAADTAYQADAAAGVARYYRYGLRGPAVLVSPYARPDHVCSDELDHTSVLKLVEQTWNLPPLTARDAAALSPLSAPDLAGPLAFLEPLRCRSRG